MNCSLMLWTGMATNALGRVEIFRVAGESVTHEERY